METVYSYSFLILLLPALSFVILALAGMEMRIRQQVLSAQLRWDWLPYCLI